MTWSHAIGAMVCAASTLIAGCDARTESKAPPASAPATAPASPPATASAPPLTTDANWRAPFDGDAIEVRHTSDGPAVQVFRKGNPDAPGAGTGDTVVIEFVARYITKDGTKTEFDSSARRGGPLRVPLQDDAAVPGLLRGLTGLRAGDVVRLQIPSTLGYGAAGRGNIPGDAALEFEVRVVSIEPSQHATP